LNDDETKMGGDFDNQISPEYEIWLPIGSLTGKSLETSNGDYFVVPIGNFLCYEIPHI
jgi:hypothetical protein